MPCLRWVVNTGAICNTCCRSRVSGCVLDFVQTVQWRETAEALRAREMTLRNEMTACPGMTVREIQGVYLALVIGLTCNKQLLGL